VLILLDNNAPRGLAPALIGHMVAEARERGWSTLKNGELLDAAEEAGFDVMVTSDKNIKYQQNLAGRKVALVVLTQGRWGLVRRKLAEIAAAVNAASPGSYTEVVIPFE
jgi:hypothetical protein